MVVFEIQKNGFKVFNNNTAGDLITFQGDTSNLPPLDLTYAWCLKQGYTPEQTIDLMLKIYHTARITKSGYFEDLSLVYGLIGNRGSGKSCGAAGIAIIDYLLALKPVWSNMGIELEVRYRDCSKVFRSIDLERTALLDVNDASLLFSNGLIVIDELNIAIGDSYRSTSNVNLFFSFMLQEIRKRKMNILYTVQSENWGGTRIRWQTDFYIHCSDRALIGSYKPTKGSIGRSSRWKLYDMSGLTGDVVYMNRIETKVACKKEVYFANTPFWNTYGTEEVQKYEPMRIQSDYKELAITTEGIKNIENDNMAVANAMIKVIQRSPGAIGRRELWTALGVHDDAGKQRRIGHLLNTWGVDSKQGTRGREYLLPDLPVFLDNLAKNGLYRGFRAYQGSSTEGSKLS